MGRVAGGQGLDLAVGQGGVADVLDLADVQPGEAVQGHRGECPGPFGTKDFHAERGRVRAMKADDGRRFRRADGGQNLMETFSALPVRSRAMRKASPTSSIGSMWLSSGDTSIAASVISRTAYRNDSRPGSPWAPYAE